MEPRQPRKHGRPRDLRDTVSLRDRMLVEWVAQAAVGDAFPQPYCWARNPLESVILTLTDLGVMARPARGTEWPAITAEASAAAVAWLQAHPRRGEMDSP